MSPTSARLLDEVTSEQQRAYDRAWSELGSTMAERPTGRSREQRLAEEQLIRFQITKAECILLALKAARVRSFFLGRTEQPFEGTA